MTVYKGVLMFHSETGTEGGHWAFQDEKFMHLPPPNDWGCERCGRIWQKDRHPEEPKPSFTYMFLYQDKTFQRDTEGNEYNVQYTPRWGAKGYDEWHDDLPLVNPESDANDNWVQWERDLHYNNNLRSQECVENGHVWQSPEERWPQGMWSYEGLHVLQDGDQVIVYSKDDPTLVVWQGTIKLKNHELFTQDAFGMWIHSDQQGEDRETWATMFIEQWPAQLERIENAKP